MSREGGASRGCSLPESGEMRASYIQYNAHLHCIADTSPALDVVGRILILEQASVFLSGRNH